MSNQSISPITIVVAVVVLLVAIAGIYKWRFGGAPAGPEGSQMGANPTEMNAPPYATPQQKGGAR